LTTEAVSGRSAVKKWNSFIRDSVSQEPGLEKVASGRCWQGAGRATPCSSLGRLSPLKESQAREKLATEKVSVLRDKQVTLGEGHLLEKKGYWNVTGGRRLFRKAGIKFCRDRTSAYESAERKTFWRLFVKRE